MHLHVNSRHPPMLLVTSPPAYYTARKTIMCPNSDMRRSFCTYVISVVKAYVQARSTLTPTLCYTHTDHR